MAFDHCGSMIGIGRLLLNGGGPCRANHPRFSQRIRQVVWLAFIQTRRFDCPSFKFAQSDFNQWLA